MSQIILETKDLSFGVNKGTLLLRHIDLHIEKGKCYILAGLNGSGKSLLLKNIKGLLNPTSGKIFIEGQDLTHSPSKRRALVGLVFQDADSQIIGQTVEKDILFGMENIGTALTTQQDRLKETARFMGLTEKLSQRPRTLSGGEKRRLAIAGIIVMEPQIILMDEPFSNLDFPGIRQVIKTLLQLKQQGYTLLIVSHEIEKFAAHADRILLLEHGMLAFDKPPKEAVELLPSHDIYVPASIPVEEMTWLRQ